MNLKLLWNSSKLITLIFLTYFLSNCATSPRSTKDGPPPFPVDLSKIHNPTPHYLPHSKYGNPRAYTVDGVHYHVLKTAKGYNDRGIASWYGTKFNGQLTSTRQPYNMLAMTAASPVLPIPTYVRVTDLENGRQVIVKVNDRGPFRANRIIDLSWAAAAKLGYANRGTALVQVMAIDTTNPMHLAAVHIPQHPRLYLQAAAFRDVHNAERLCNRLEHLTHHHVEIHTNYYRHLAFYDVQIGPLVSVKESDKLHALLMHDGFGNAISVVR